MSYTNLLGISINSLMQGTQQKRFSSYIEYTIYIYLYLYRTHFFCEEYPYTIPIPNPYLFLTFSFCGVFSHYLVYRVFLAYVVRPSISNAMVRYVMLMDPLWF